MLARHTEEGDFFAEPVLGGASGAELKALETTVNVTWLQTFSALLSVTGVAWDGGSAPLGPRHGDVLIKDIARRAVLEQTEMDEKRRRSDPGGGNSS